MKSIFIGTRIEALEKLEELTEVLDIITIKDSYIDNKRKKKIIVNKHNKEEINSFLTNSSAKLIFSSGYPFILPKKLISIKKKIFINSHPSILPKYKGRKCIKRAYENNEDLYGCTLHYMSENVDSGKIISQQEVILKNYSLEKIYQYLFSICEVEVIEKGLKKILNL